MILINKRAKSKCDEFNQRRFNVYVNISALKLFTLKVTEVFLESFKSWRWKIHI